jgi:hypothetical protein
MMKCWQEDKDSRPTFKELVEILDKIIEHHTSSEVIKILSKHSSYRSFILNLYPTRPQSLT